MINLGISHTRRLSVFSDKQLQNKIAVLFLVTTVCATSGCEWLVSGAPVPREDGKWSGVVRRHRLFDKSGGEHWCLILEIGNPSSGVDALDDSKPVLIDEGLKILPVDSFKDGQRVVVSGSQLVIPLNRPGSEQRDADLLRVDPAGTASRFSALIVKSVQPG